jgi:hypothetical protein
LTYSRYRTEPDHPGGPGCLHVSAPQLRYGFMK